MRKEGKGAIEVPCHRREMALTGIDLNFHSPGKKVLFFNFLTYLMFYDQFPGASFMMLRPSFCLQGYGSTSWLNSKLQASSEISCLSPTACHEGHILACRYRNVLLTSNQNLRRALAEVLKTTAAAEETLGLHMQSLSTSKEDDQSVTWERTTVEPLRSHPAGKHWEKKKHQKNIVIIIIIY